MNALFVFISFFDHKFLYGARNYGIPMSGWTMNMAKNIPINLSHLNLWLFGVSSRSPTTNQKYSSLNQLSMDQNTLTRKHTHIHKISDARWLYYSFIYKSIRVDSIHWKFHIQTSFGRKKTTPNAICFSMTNNSISSHTHTQNDLMNLFKCVIFFLPSFLLSSIWRIAWIDLMRLHCIANCWHCVAAIFAIHSIDCIHLSFIHISRTYYMQLPSISPHTHTTCGNSSFSFILSNDALFWTPYLLYGVHDDDDHHHHK